MEMKMSAASKRASEYKRDGGEWFCGFEYTPAKGLGYEEGIHRRDPSSVIKASGLYYVWYTKSIGAYFGLNNKGSARTKLFPWDQADIWYATSPDGINWTEIGVAVERGSEGTFDDRTVCTPDILAHEGKYYLVYQTQSSNASYTGSSENVGMAIASCPDGPWEKIQHNILEPMANGQWFGETNNYNNGNFTGFNHDPSLFYYNGEFWLYYKCGASDFLEHLKYAGQDTRWGVAMSKNPEGPYKHCEFNPVTNSGHETMLWHYDGGIAALINRDGPEKNTIQYAKDGINFEVMARIENTPQAGGAFRSEYHDEHPLEGVRWGLCHVDERGSLWNYILRFDLDQRHPYQHALEYPKANSISLF